MAPHQHRLVHRLQHPADYGKPDKNLARFVLDSGGFSALTDGAVPEGFAYKVVRPWYAKMEDCIGLQAQWVEEWNQINNYRQ